MRVARRTPVRPSWITSSPRRLHQTLVLLDPVYDTSCASRLLLPANACRRASPPLLCVDPLHSQERHPPCRSMLVCFRGHQARESFFLDAMSQTFRKIAWIHDGDLPDLLRPLRLAIQARCAAADEQGVRTGAVRPSLFRDRMDHLARLLWDTSSLGDGSGSIFFTTGFPHRPRLTA